MELLYFVLLGMVQGLTEFLPVSSSGHLVFLDKIFNVETGNFLFVSILLHIATLISVIILYYKQIWQLIKNPFSKKTLLIVVATIPTVIIVLLFKGFFENAFGGEYLPICFMITAIVLMLSYFKTKSNNKCLYKKLNYNNAIIIGIMQGFAVLPGISRSGSTISAGVLQGVNSEDATAFSFTLSIPIILASLVYEVYSCLGNGQQFYTGSYFNLILSFIIALVCGIFAIKIMKKFAKTGKYYFFSIYLIVIAIISCFV